VVGGVSVGEVEGGRGHVEREGERGEEGKGTRGYGTGKVGPCAKFWDLKRLAGCRRRSNDVVQGSTRKTKGKAYLEYGIGTASSDTKDSRT